MSILGIGIDIVSINRISRLFYLYKKKLAKKILSNKELIYFYNNKDQIRFLAKRFATKEAIVKAFGTGFSQGITFNQLEIYNNDLGKPKINFLNYAYLIYKKLKIKKIHISITDEKKYACSFIIIES